MPKLPAEDQLEPTHTLGGEPTGEDAPAPELDDYDQAAEPSMPDARIDDVAIPESEDDDVEAELDGGE